MILLFVTSCLTFLWKCVSAVFNHILVCFFRCKSHWYLKISRNKLIWEFKYFWKSSFVQKEDNVSYQFDLYNKYTFFMAFLLSHWFYFLAASAACFTASFQFFSSFSISHSLSVINMHVFHNPHHEKHRSIIYPPYLNADPMTYWQNNAV